MSLRSDPINFEEFWPPIEKLLNNILHQQYKNISNDRWQETFFDIYKVCVAQPEPLVGVLYLRLKTLLQRHVQELCKVSRAITISRLHAAKHISINISNGFTTPL